MDRRTVFLASAGAISVVACGGEPGEEFSELQQGVTILVTSAMPVKKFSYSSYGLMTYLLAPPVRTLFLGSISVQRIAGTGIVTGSITPGTAAKPGRANLQVSPEIYDNLLATSPGYNGVQLSFESLTLVPVAISVS